MRKIPTLSELRPRAAATSAAVRQVWVRRRASALTAGLAGLVVATSFAVATVSWWLVPPYLLVMGFVLFAPGGTNDEEPQPSILVGPHTTIEPPDNGNEDLSPDETNEEESGSSNVTGNSTGSGKTRRGKSRGKRSAKTQPEVSSEATWIQVGPGKFVRVEGSEASNNSLPQEEAATDPTTDLVDDPSGREVGEPIEPTPASLPIEDELSDEFDSATVVTELEPDVEPEELAEGLEEFADESFSEEVERGRQDDMAEDNGNAPDAFDEANDHGNAPEAFAGMSDLAHDTESEERYAEDLPDSIDGSGSESVSTDQVVTLVIQSVELPEPEVESEDTDTEFDDHATASVEEELICAENSHGGTISYWVSTGVFPPRRNIRSGRTNQVPAGFRCRSRRGLGRKRRSGRRSQIRSPPRVCRHA